MCVCDSTQVTSRTTCTMVAAANAVYAPKRLGFHMPSPPETLLTSVAQCRGGFRKKVFGPPSLNAKKGRYERTRENLLSENRVANCTLPVRTFPRVDHGRAQHRHLPNRRCACTYIGRDASDAYGGRARGLAHEELRDTAPILQPPRLSEIGAITGCGRGEPSNSLAPPTWHRSKWSPIGRACAW